VNTGEKTSSFITDKGRFDLFISRDIGEVLIGSLWLIVKRGLV
jgi:hypothetical protein